MLDESVELLEATRLHVESEENEWRVGEVQHDERWREGERLIDLEPRQLVCTRFWRERAKMWRLQPSFDRNKVATYAFSFL